MPDLPFIDAATAVAVGRSVIPPGPSVSRVAAERVVAGLRRAAALSERHVREVTHLDVDATGPVAIIDRPTWLRLNVDQALAMLGDAADGGLREARTPLHRLAARANGVQLGAALALVGNRVLGQWLPFLDVGQLVLVAPNIAAVESDLKLRPADFRLWVCLHEQTHRLQFARAPWLKDHLIAEAARLLSAGDGGSGLRLRGSLLDAVLTGEQREVLGRVGATMSLLEGYAEDMMDRVGPRVIPTVTTIRSRFDGRRSRGGWRQVVNRALGLDLKLAQYRDGARFCRAVVGRVGVDGLNAVYEGPSHLPTTEELTSPALWVKRIHG